MAPRFVRLILPVLVLVLLLFLGWLSLRAYTRHNVAMRVPDLKSLSFEEAEVMLAKRDLLAMVIDSVYVEDLPKGSVVDQSPKAGAEVKPDRKVYLVLNASQPKMIDMPGLIDLSKRQAISVVEIIGLKIKELQYRPDACVDCVVDQLYKGQHIEPDARIRRGEAITLVLGSGDNGERVPVPELIGLTTTQALTVLNMASLNLGIVVECAGCNTRIDSSLARVRRQSPDVTALGRVPMGSIIDIWLTSDTAGLSPKQGWDDPSLYMKADTADVDL
jgi:beta-lactam-binding protein with PASTA domain